MMIDNIKEKIKLNLLNTPGFRTKRKIVVFESDDWGSIRMRSRQDYDYFLKKGYQVDQCPYNKYDALESNDDLVGLFDILDKFRDKNNNLPIYTLNNIVANPNFKKIKQSNYQEYHYEPFTETLKKYPNHDKVYTLYKEGIENKLIQTQFHGREHLNVKRWMFALNKNEENIVEAFEKEMFTVYKSGSFSGRNNYLDTFGLSDFKSIKDYKNDLKDGLELFYNLWGFNSKSFIAPTYVWPVVLEKVLNNLNVKYLQGTHVQRVPKINHDSGVDRKYHYLGQKNKLGQVYLVRNAFFEPSSDSTKDWVNSCLKDINRAFKWKKPAIISTHRLNYIGGIHTENRADNLKLLNTLLKKIVKTYPEVEFMSSDELGDLIAKKE